MSAAHRPPAEISAIIREMTATEARNAIDTIKAATESIRVVVYDIHQREGWRALGYKSWRACVAAEFPVGERYLYRELQAALIEVEIWPMGQIGTVPERQLRPLASVPEGQRKAAYDKAIEIAGDEPVKAKHVEQAAAIVTPRPKPTKFVPDKQQPTVEPEDESQDFGDAWEEPQDEPEPVKGKTKVNGVLVDDPPDVADRRARGLITADSVPERNDAVPLDTTPYREAGEDEPETDGEWLDTLPLCGQLAGEPYKTFRADAMIYRRFLPAREVMREGAATAFGNLRRSGEFGSMLNRLLKADNPKHWHLCPPTSDGGCAGLGNVPGFVGQKCSICYGRGYTIKERKGTS